MDLRNLTRYYTFNKALKKRNKAAAIKLLPRQFNVLFALYLHTRTNPFTTAKQVYLFMLRTNRGIKSADLYAELIKLESIGFLTSDNPGTWKVKKYSITFDGLQCLQDFEQIHRNERLDK